MIRGGKTKPNGTALGRTIFLLIGKSGSVMPRTANATLRMLETFTHGWVIELQHSPISPSGTWRSRDAFYRQVVWVVDGTRRKTDAARFARAWDNGTTVGRTFPVQRLHADDSALLREWSDSLAPIFFDFGGQALAWLLPGRFNRFVYVTQIPRDQFIHIQRTGRGAGMSLPILLAGLRSSANLSRASSRPHLSLCLCLDRRQEQLRTQAARESLGDVFGFRACLVPSDSRAETKAVGRDPLRLPVVGPLSPLRPLRKCKRQLTYRGPIWSTGGS